jgi:hypothetical protein
LLKDIFTITLYLWKKCYNNRLYEKIYYYFAIIGIYPKKYSSPGNNLSNLEQNKK